MKYKISYNLSLHNENTILATLPDTETKYHVTSSSNRINHERSTKSIIGGHAHTSSLHAKWQAGVLWKYYVPADKCQFYNYSLNSADDIVNNS